MSKTAFITGATGQDGSYLSELLLNKGYVVHGLMRRCSVFNSGRVDHLMSNANYKLHYGDLLDFGCLFNLISSIQPDEVYNLAAQSHVMVSFEMPSYTLQTNIIGTANLLEACRIYENKTSRKVRFYQASSSEMFGSSPPPQNESTLLHPRSPYGVSKVAGHNLAINYRESYGMHVSSGVLFNHESERRGETFVSRKITRALTRISCGLQKELVLGNLDAKRDWGHAKDYVEAMWLMLQQTQPDDYVIATGHTYSVRDFLDKAAACLGLDWTKYVRIDPKYFRPAEVDVLLGDATKAKTQLGWEPKISFDQLVGQMVASDLLLAKEEANTLSFHEQMK